MDRQALRNGLLLFVLLLAFAVRISGLTSQSLWRDEVDALRFSQASLPTLLSNFGRVGWNGPLYYVLLRPWVTFAGQSEIALRGFSLCFGVLGVALSYRLGREWFTPLVGGLSALLMACSPYMVWYSQEAKMYTLVCALALATLLVYYRALVSNDWRAWTAVLVLVWCTIGVHIMGGLLVPVLVLLFFVWWRIARTRWPQALVVLAGIIAPVVVALPWAFPLLLRGGDIGHRFLKLPDMLVVMLNAFGRGVLSEGRVIPMALALFCALAGTVLWSRPESEESVLGQEPRHVIALWVWLAVPLLGLYAISLRVPMFVDRYLIWIGPAFYMLIARGLDQIRRRSMIVSVLCLVAMLWLSGQGIVQQSTTPIKSDFRGAAAYVQAYRRPGELLLFHISYIRHTFEYYYGDAVPYADGVPTDDATTELAVDAAMRDRTAGHDVVWLVLSEPEMWDRRGMTLGWLETHAEVETRMDLTRVSVIKYRLS